MATKYQTCVGTIPVRKDAKGKWEVLMLKTRGQGWGFPSLAIEKGAPGAKQESKKAAKSCAGVVGKLEKGKLGKWRFPEPRNEDLRLWVQYVDECWEEDDERITDKRTREWKGLGQAKNAVKKTKDDECKAELLDILKKLKAHLKDIDNVKAAIDDDAPDDDDNEEPIIVDHNVPVESDDEDE